MRVCCKNIEIGPKNWLEKGTRATRVRVSVRQRYDVRAERTLAPPTLLVEWSRVGRWYYLDEVILAESPLRN